MAEKINILFVLPNFDTGGSEKLVFDLIKHLDKSRFSPVLCVFFTGKYEEDFLKLGVPFYVIHKNGVRSKIATVKFLNKIIKDHTIRIVNTHHNSPLIQGVVPFKVFNKVYWVHTEHTRLDLDPNVTPRIMFLEKICLKFVDVVLGISQGVCDYFKKELKIAPKKIKKVLNGVDIERFQLNGFDREGYKKKLGLGEEALIGMFANFREQKNHENIIQAARIMKDKKEKAFKVLLCGTGPRLEPMKALAKELNVDDRVIFLGARMDIPELMNMIDIYCLPSHFEGLPFSLIEAMAAGKAVVATKVIGNDEVVLDHQNGIFAKANDPDDLALQVGRLINDRNLRERLSAKALDDAARYSFERMMKEYETLFAGDAVL